MRKPLAAFFAVFLLTLIAAVPAVQAVPTNVNVRIEGKEETLFERTIPVAIQKIKASSDSQERDCDGINELDPGNVLPKVTPTLASVEAMSSIGEGFDGQWYEGYGDYFITRWGPDSQDTVAGAYWGILVNEIYTSVGGCQLQLDENDEVLWIWDAFKGRPTLALYPEEAHYSAGPRPVTAIVHLGQPFPVEVVSFPDGGEGIPGDQPSRAGSSPYSGAEVAPVTTNAKGFQRIDAASPQTVKTNAQGRATIVFTEPGIHRIKATVGAPGDEDTIVRSNRIDVCVPAVFGDCGERPPAQPAAPPSPPAPQPNAARIGAPKLDRSKIAQGKVGVSWKVLDPGAGVKSWRISSQEIGAKGAEFVVRASGKKQTQATVKLPRGATYRLRLSLTEVTGKTTSVGLGKITVPRASAP
ncbi:MAG TPA: hypothetical protein VLL27_12945 [Solirubrobacterales bacterium]|nr:hypothetical protein [Solirubrobacterales bacterium]